MKKTLTSLILVLAIGLNSKAANYYIAASGNDANNGTSTSTPWKTLSKLNSFFSSLKAGDNVYLNRGDVFYGSITVNKSGSSGSPITIGAYGSGANPVVTGFTTVSAWTNLGGNIWESTSTVSTLSTCNIVAINGVNTPMGRYPNTGWLSYQSHSGTTSITSNQLSGSPNWTGAEVVTRIIRWILERDVIKSQSGGTLTYAGAGNTPTDGYGFFIQNDVRTLDAQNEWYYNPSTKKIRVYSTSTPTNVQVASVDEVILNSNANYITYDHIDFKGANSYLFENRNSKNVIVQNCSLEFAGKIAMYINSAVSSNESMTIDGNLFSDNNDNAMKFLSYASNIWIKNNTINNTGMIPGAGTNDQNGYDAIDVFGQNTIVEYNSINNTGHIALGMRQSDGMIARYNYISYFGMTKYDAGGIYSWNQDSTTVKSRIWDHNIVLYSKQTSDGIGTATPSLFGIYLDGDSKNTTITNNTVAHVKGGNGIFILNSGSCTISNNTSYDNTSQLAFIHAWNFGMTINKMVVRSNVFISRTADQVSFSFRDDDNTLFNKFGTADSNYYARPISDNSPIMTQIQYDPTNLSVAGWQSVSGQDAHSKKSPKTITDTNDLRFEYNATSSYKTISLPYNYIDVKNNSYNGSITLAPYTSAVLIKNGAATGNQPPTADAGADQTINLPTSSVNLSGSGSDLDGTISSYLWTKISGPSGGTITNASAAATTVTALIQGVYQFQLKVTDNSGATGLDTVAINVNALGNLLAAVNPGSIVNGVNYSYYESSSYSVVPSFASLTPVKSGTVSNFDISVANRATAFAMNFTGYINIPADGQYTFYTNSDDGSNLYIDNNLVVNNDGIHAPLEKSGTIGLKAGYHAISVSFFQQSGGSVLTVSYASSGISKQVIPSSALFTPSSSGSLLPAVNPGTTTNGISYSYYESSSYSALPNFASLTPVKSGTVSNFDISIANRATAFAVNFTGFINIPADGQYTFYTNSDDGSNLYIDNIWVVNNDGLHSPLENSGNIGLKAGYHAISVGFFQQGGGSTLIVSYSSSGISKQVIPSSILYIPSTSGNLLAAVNPGTTNNGINYSYYQSGSYSTVPDFTATTPVKSGTVSNFDISIASRSTVFAVKFSGYINVPTDGQYTFYTSSDDGSNLYIDNLWIVNNDGIHGTQEKWGTVGLKAGNHAISIGYFQQTGGSMLTVSYSGPGISKQVIPSSALFIVPGTLALTNNSNQAIFSSDQVGVKVYPNPFADNIVININGDAGNYSLMLVDVSGKVMWRKNGTKAEGTLQQSINTSALLRGVYFLKVIQNNNSSVIKLVK